MSHSRTSVTDPNPALDSALDDAARSAERALVESGATGIRFVVLDEDLNQVCERVLPADRVPPTPEERRHLMECLAPNILAGAGGYIVASEGFRGRQQAEPSDLTDVMILQAETRAGDRRVTLSDHSARCGAADARTARGGARALPRDVFTAS